MFLGTVFSGSQCQVRDAAPTDMKIFHDLRPTLKWAHQRGRLYTVQCIVLARSGNEEDQVIVNLTNYPEGKFTPDTELQFNRAYSCKVTDQMNEELVLLDQNFTIQFEKADLYLPKDKLPLRNLRPRFQWKPATYPFVRYKLSVSTDPQLTSRQDYWIEASATQHFPGPDNQLGTDDDVIFVEYAAQRDLTSGSAYYWMVTTYYFGAEDLARGKRPKEEEAAGQATSAVNTFSIPSQNQMNESLAGVMKITDRRGGGEAKYPQVSKANSVAYTAIDPDGSYMIHVISGSVRDGHPTFDRADQEFTRAVRGSYDMLPYWDPTNQGIYFTSNRTGLAAIWHKGTSGRGFELVSNATTDVLKPSISDDGKTIVFVQHNASNAAGRMTAGDSYSVWKMDPDGRSPTDLGEGFDAQISHSGKKVVACRKDNYGRPQVVVIPLDGSGQPMFLTNDGENVLPSWSPDDSRIVWVAEKDGSNKDIWVMNADGSRPTRLTDFIGPDEAPAFTPDGQHIVFASTRGGGGTFQLWMGQLSVTTPPPLPGGAR
jgi:Tol biopolymer transport system component